MTRPSRPRAEDLDRAEGFSEERLVRHPVFVLAVVTLLLNDHVLKDAFRGAAWTGKLSDVAGLVFFPVVLWCLVRAVLERTLDPRRCIVPTRLGIDLAAVTTALVFAAIQTIPAAGELWVWSLGALQLPFRALAALFTDAPMPAWAPVAHTADWTDLYTLPASAWAPLAVRLDEARLRTARAPPV